VKIGRLLLKILDQLWKL